jgi:LmbE family N-acetylglucosaminyl deacetylase
VELILKSNKVLALAAHPDDLEIGCFGALSYCNNPHLLVMSRGESGGQPEVRTREAFDSAELVNGRLTQLSFPDTRIDTVDIVREIEKIVEEVGPGVILTMPEEDSHQDHQAVANAALIALRHFDGLVLSYATPSSLHKFSPQVILGLNQESMDLKLRAIALHSSQNHRRYMQFDYVQTVAKYWALMSRVDMEYGEAFKVLKWNSNPS